MAYESNQLVVRCYGIFTHSNELSRDVNHSNLVRQGRETDLKHANWIKFLIKNPSASLKHWPHQKCI